MAQQESNARGAGPAAPSPQRENAPESKQTNQGQSRRQDERQGQPQSPNQKGQGQGTDPRTQGQGHDAKNQPRQGPQTPGRTDTNMNAEDGDGAERDDANPKDQNTKNAARPGDSTARPGDSTGRPGAKKA